MSLAWFYLLLAGLLEVAWATGLRYTHGFTRPLPSILVGSAIVASMYLLALAQRTLPIAVAYAVWVGIGVAGTALLSAFVLHEPLRPAQWGYVMLLLVAVAGLKATTP